MKNSQDNDIFKCNLVLNQPITHTNQHLLGISCVQKVSHKGPKEILGCFGPQWTHCSLLLSTWNNRISPGKGLIRKGPWYMHWFYHVSCAKTLGTICILFSYFKGKGSFLFYNIIIKVTTLLFSAFILLPMLYHYKQHYNGHLHEHSIAQFRLFSCSSSQKWDCWLKRL